MVDGGFLRVLLVGCWWILIGVNGVVVERQSGSRLG